MTAQANHRVRSISAAFLVGIVGVVVAVAFDRWYAQSLIAREGDRIRALAAPYAEQITGYFDLRVSRLDALRAFVEAEPAMQSLNADFPTFAEGLSSAAPGVRAFQLVRKGRIMRSWPEHDDSLLVGVDLYKHPNREVSDGLRRAMDTTIVVLTGPVRLLQGGDGFIARQTLRPFGPEGPDMVAMVLDLESLIREAAPASIPQTVAFALYDHRKRLLVGRDSIPSPISITLPIADVTWTLHMAPSAGWRGAVTTELRTTRTASALLWVMLMYIALTVITRQRALASAVDDRTRELEQANAELRREVAERLQLEERLLHSQKMEAVGTLAGGIAHDFNNLLTAITGFAQLSDEHSAGMQDRAPNAEEREQLKELRTDLAEILKAADRASLLTSQLLAFSRRQKVTPNRHDVNGIVHDLERMLQRLIGERVALVTDVSPGPLCVHVDNGQLSQVLMNLVVNARDALPAGGTVHITTQSLQVEYEYDGPFRSLPPGDWVVIGVQDTGTGMTPEIMSRMFEPFFTTKRIGDGTGLGLSMVYGIVTQAGGHVFVESAPGEGTTVSVVLPRITGAPDPAALETAEVPRSEGDLVLVVEDEAGLRRLVGEILRRKGFRVEVAPDGRDALELLEQIESVPDLVLTDVVMPRMGGQELASELERRGLMVPILFMSGYQDGEEMPDDPRYTYIAKPFAPDALVDKVRAALGLPV